MHQMFGNASLDAERHFVDICCCERTVQPKPTARILMNAGASKRSIKQEQKCGVVSDEVPGGHAGRPPRTFSRIRRRYAMRACALKPRSLRRRHKRNRPQCRQPVPKWHCLSRIGSKRREVLPRSLFRKARKKRKNGFAGIERCDAQANSFADSMRRCEEVDERHHVGQ